MRDLFFVGFMLFLFGLCFIRPYLATICYIWIDLLQPQQQSYYLLNSVPISMIAAIGAVLAYLIADKNKQIRINPIQILLFVFIVWITITTSTAVVQEAAWIKYSSAWKALGFAIFLPFVLRTRLQIETALLVILFTLCALMFSGAFKTALGGGGYGNLSFLVVSNTGLFEASTMAAVSVGIIPIALYLYRHSLLFPPSKWTRLVTAGIVGSAVLVVVGAEARTGLLCLGAIALIEFRNVKRKMLITVATVVIGIASIPFLPSSFTDRMNTIKTYDEDSSASTRVVMWQWTWDFAKAHPLGGGFGVWRTSQITVETRSRSGDSQSSREKVTVTKDKARGFHSSYFEVMGEQGFIGLAIFLSIFLGTLIQLGRISRRFRDDAEMAWAGACARGLAGFIIIYMIGSLFQALAFQTTAYHFISISIALANLAARHKAPAVQKPQPLIRPGARRTV